MRVDLAAAAVACDYTALATTLADRVGRAVRFSFGAETDAAAYWRSEEEAGHGLPPMWALRTLLALPYGVSQAPGGPVTYVWPAAFATEHPTDAQLAEIAAAGLYPISTLRQWVDSGTNYLGYRVLITAAGDWTAFVAGD